MDKIKQNKLPWRMTEDLIIKEKGSNSAIGMACSKEVGELIIEAVNVYPEFIKMINQIKNL